MTLEEYRTKNCLTYAELANVLGVEGKNPARTVQRYSRLERIPSRAAIREIAARTDNAVADGDWPDAPSRTMAAADEQATA